MRTSRWTASLAAPLAAALMGGLHSPAATADDADPPEPSTSATAEQEAPGADDVTAQDEPFPADTSPDHGEASDDAALSPVDMTFGEHGDYDRVVLELTGPGTPGWTAEYTDTPTEAGSGEPVDLAGTAYLTIDITGVVPPTYPGAEPYVGPEQIQPGSSGVVAEVVHGPLFEGHQQLFIGLTSAEPFRVFALGDPTRIVIDVYHPDVANAAPIGVLEGASLSGGLLSVGGWAFDPDQPTESLAVHVYIDDRGRAITADLARPDVAAAYPEAGPLHGFALRTPVTGGSHTVCAHAVDLTNTAQNTDLGCLTVSLGSQAAREYVTKVYADLLDRGPDPAGLATWTDALVGGTPYSQVANAITSSNEYRSRLITTAYETYLDRSPDSGGLASWLAALRNGMRIIDLRAGFVGSAEFHQDAGGTDRAWVTRLYEVVLDRMPGDSEVDHWARVLAGGASRAAVARGFLYSTENLTTLVNGYYVDLLDRSIDPSGQATWVRLIQTGTREEQIIASIVSSPEYRLSD